MEQQDKKGPISLEDYDYDVHETHLTKDLLKSIIKRLKQTNENINFLVFHFAQELRHLAPGMFIDYDEDTEELSHFRALVLSFKCV